MNPLDDLNGHDALSWSAHLGALAAQSPTTRPDSAFNQPTRPSALLRHLRRRQRQEQAADKFRANEFILGD